MQRNFGKILANFAKSSKKSAKISAIFNENFEIRERCKGVHCVDLDESFPTSIYLQNLASIQPRTSPKKFGKTGKRDFEISFALTPVRAFEIGGQGTTPPRTTGTSPAGTVAEKLHRSGCGRSDVPRLGSGCLARVSSAPTRQQERPSVTGT